LLRRIFGCKREEVTKWWRKLHNEELDKVLCSPNRPISKVKECEMGGASMEAMRNSYKILVGNSEVKNSIWKT
jgi:hypothetical protein